jgi:AI-2 transport protein TqsA
MMMIETNNFSKLNRFVIGAASLGVALLIVRQFADFIATLIVSVILAILFIPFLHRLEKKGLPKTVAFVITLIVLILVLVGMFLFLTVSVAQLTATIPTYVAEMESVKVNAQASLASSGLDPNGMAKISDLLNPSQLVDIFAELLALIAGVISDGVTVLFTFSFLVLGASGFSAKATQLIKQGNLGLARIYKFNQDIRVYLLITHNVGLAAAAINTVMLAIIGVDFALLWGILSYLLSYVPYIGFILALIPPTVLALLEFGLPTAVFIVLFYIVINTAIDNVVKPRLMGQELDLSPVIVFLSVIFWGMILGPLGGLLAVPVTMGIKQLVIEPDPANRWIAELISGGNEA